MAKIDEILSENSKRQIERSSDFDPVSGYHSIGERTFVTLLDYPIPEMWLPNAMLKDKFIKKVLYYGTIEEYCKSRQGKGIEAAYVVDAITRLRCYYDFPFWAYAYAKIKSKEGGDDIPFLLKLLYFP